MSCVEKRGALFSSADDSERAYLADMDQESNESSADDTESPRSVVEKRNRKKSLKNQVLRIRAEHSNLVEDDNYEGNWRKFFMLFSRPMLPASPLGSRTMD